MSDRSCLCCFMSVGKQLRADSPFFCALVTFSLSSLGRGDIPNHSLEPSLLHDLLYCDHGRFLDMLRASNSGDEEGRQLLLCSRGSFHP